MASLGTRRGPRFTAAVVGLASLIGAPAASGADEKQRCADAYHTAQELKLAGELTAAREQLTACARATCPDAVRDDCTKWLGEVTDALPTIVVVAKGPGGVDLVDVRVLVDGEVLAERLDGRGIPIDPGAHQLRFERHDGQTPAVERGVVIREGIKNRPVEVVFGDSPPSDPAAPVGTPSTTAEAGAPVGAFVLGGLGLAALGVFTGLAVTGTGEVEDLRDTCGQTHSCTDEQIDAARTKLIVADVFLYSGVACLGVGIGWLIVHYVDEPADEAAFQIGVFPTTGGAAATLGWSF